MAARIATRTALLIFSTASLPAILAYRHCFEFLIGNFLQAGLLSKNILASDFDILSKLILDFKINLDIIVK